MELVKHYSYNGDIFSYYKHNKREYVIMLKRHWKIDNITKRKKTYYHPYITDQTTNNVFTLSAFENRMKARAEKEALLFLNGFVAAMEMKEIK